MSSEESNTRSFLDSEAENIGLAEKLDVLSVVDKSCSQEGWCVAWTPDNTYVAWSQGGGIVYLLPWDSKKNKLFKKPARNQSYDNLTELESQPFIDNLPRLTSEVCNEEEENDLCWNHPTVTDEHVKDDDDYVDDARKSLRIDCMDFVWSIAFGHGIPTSQNSNRNQFKFKSDLILATGLQGGKIKLWNVHTGNLLIELLDHKSNVRGLSFTCDGSLKLASCSNDCTIKFWDLNDDCNMYKTVRFKENVMVFSCKWSPNNKHFAAVGMNKCAYVWNTSNFMHPRKLVGHHHNVLSCDFSPDGGLLATASYDTRVIIWDPFTGDQIKVFGHMFPSPRPIYAGGANEHYVRCVSFSRLGHRLATVADDGYVRFWCLETNSEDPNCVAESPKPLSCAYSAAGTILAAGCRDGSIEIFRPKTPDVPTLQHLCRVSIRQRIKETQQVDHLHFPFRLKEFIKYKLL